MERKELNEVQDGLPDLTVSEYLAKWVKCLYFAQLLKNEITKAFANTCIEEYTSYYHHLAKYEIYESLESVTDKIQERFETAMKLEISNPDKIKNLI